MQEISKAKISLINSLAMKKFREQHSLFVVEGNKIIYELIKSNFKIKFVVYNTDKCDEFAEGNFEVYYTTDAGMKRISSLKTTPPVLAVAEIPQFETDFYTLKNKLSMAVDDIQDPGNLGTLIRICDWFGIENLVCSQNSADLYNPKVMQATMGAFLRVTVHYVNLNDFIVDYKTQTGHNRFGTFLEGDNIYKSELPACGLIVLGNEGHGISLEIEKSIDKKLYIPPFSTAKTHAESLNIASAASVVCSEFRRRV